MLNVQGPFQVARSVDFMSTGLTDFDAVSLKVKLYQNDLVPSPATILADFIEADFSGYAADTIVAADYPDFRLMPDGSALGLVLPVQDFNDTANTVPNTVFGVYITNTGGTVLLASIRFDTPKVMDDVGKFISIELALRMPSGSPDAEADVTSNG